MSSSTASASSRSDVIGVRRSCETAATRSRRAGVGLIARGLLGAQPRRSSRWPRPRARPARRGRRSRSRTSRSPRADRGQAVADRLDVAQDRVRDQLRRDDGEHARRRPRSRATSAAVVVGDDHQQPDHDECDQHRRDGDRDRQRELARQRTGSGARDRADQRGTLRAAAPPALTAGTGSRRPTRSGCGAAAPDRPRSSSAAGGCGR